MRGCPFCYIISGAAPARVVLADRHAVAFLDTHPVAPGHVLVVPRRHVATLSDLHRSDVGPFFERVRLVAQALPLALGADGTFVANHNVVNQTVPHLHMHVVPRLADDGRVVGALWPRTTYQSAAHADAVARAITAALGHSSSVP